MRTPTLAYLTGEYPRATDTFIQREVAALRAQGFDVDTFSVRRPGPEHVTGAEQREGQATTTYLLELAKTADLVTSHVTTLIRHPARYFQGLSLAWKSHRPGIKGAVLNLIYFVEAVVLARQLAKRNIDHLHNHFGDSSCTLAMLTAQVAGIPFSFTLHGSGIFFEARSWRLDEKLSRATFCACISHFTRSQAAIFAAPEVLDRIHIVHCGVEPDTLTPVVHRGQATRLVFVGRLVEQKGLSVLFEAMNMLTDATPGLTLTVIGDGPDRGGLERRVAQLGLSDRIEFVGSKSQSEVAALLADSEIFVLPSYAEGVPVVVMEALGSGVPVVASFVGGMAELVEDGVTGYLVRPGDPQQLADRLGRLLDDPELRNAFGKAGRAKVTADFDSSEEAARLGTLFVNSAAGLPSPMRPGRAVVVD